MSGPQRLTDEEAAEHLRHLPSWRIEAGKLTKAFTFGDFVEAVRFVDQLTPIAESQGHHPDLQVGWGRVTVELSSHDAGGITEKDFALAEAIERL